MQPVTKERKKEMKFTANATSTRWAVTHLGKTVTTSELFSSKVFTDFEGFGFILILRPNYARMQFKENLKERGHRK